MDALEIDRAMLVGHSFGGVIAMHAAALHPDRIEAVVLSDPSFAALRHLEDLGRWGHWQNFREEAAQAGVTLSSEHWYDLARFFDQVLHLDGEQLLRFRQAVGLPGLNRLLRLATTTCGEDAKAVAGLTEDLIFGVTQPVLALFGEFSPFLATADHLAATPAPLRQPARARGQAPGARGELRAVRRAGVRVPDDGPAIGRGGEAEPMNTKPTVLLTGAAHGIGHATAMALARRGTPLGLIDRDGPALAALAQELVDMGATVADAVADVTDRDALQRAVAAITARIGPIEVLVACAGIGTLTLVPDLDTAMLRQILDVNVVGVAQSIEAVLPGMIAQGTGPHRRRGQRGRLPRLPLDDLLFRVEGRADRLPRGPAAGPAPAGRDGDHRLPRVRPDTAQHDRTLPAAGQDDRARGGGPPPRSRGRAPAPELRLPLGHADRPGHPQVHARPILRPPDALVRPSGDGRRVLISHWSLVIGHW